MRRVLLRRLLVAIPVLLLITLVAFSLLELVPGDVATVLAGEGAREETVASIRTELGLDQSPVARYGTWLHDFVQGDLGNSLFYRTPVSELILTRMPVTLSITSLAVLLGLLIGVPAGVVAGVSNSRIIDRLVTAGATAFVSIPGYVFAMLFALILGLYLGWFPTIGYTSITESTTGWAVHIFLPSLALSFAPAAVIARQLRGSLREIMQKDYVRTARAKGLPSRRIIARHALREASGPAVMALSAQVAILLSGAVAVEVVFALPGLGALALQAVSVRDFPVVQGVVVASALAVMVMNLMFDVAYAMMNPRARSSM